MFAIFAFDLGVRRIGRVDRECLNASRVRLFEPEGDHFPFAVWMAFRRRSHSKPVNHPSQRYYAICAIYLSENHNIFVRVRWINSIRFQSKRNDCHMFSRSHSVRAYESFVSLPRVRSGVRSMRAHKWLTKQMRTIEKCSGETCIEYPKRAGGIDQFKSVHISCCCWDFLKCALHFAFGDTAWIA